MYALLVILPTLAFSITSMVIGATNPPCNVEDTTVIDLTDYLTATGIANLATICLYVLGAANLFQSKAISNFVLYFDFIASALFQIAWIVVGGVVLYRDNIDCIGTEVSANYAVWMWVLSVLLLFAEAGTLFYLPSLKINVLGERKEQ